MVSNNTQSATKRPTVCQILYAIKLPPTGWTNDTSQNHTLLFAPAEIRLIRPGSVFPIFYCPIFGEPMSVVAYINFCNLNKIVKKIIYTEWKKRESAYHLQERQAWQRAINTRQTALGQSPQITVILTNEPSFVKQAVKTNTFCFRHHNFGGKWHSPEWAETKQKNKR